MSRRSQKPKLAKDQTGKHEKQSQKFCFEMSWKHKGYCLVVANVTRTGTKCGDWERATVHSACARAGTLRECVVRRSAARAHGALGSVTCEQYQDRSLTLDQHVYVDGRARPGWIFFDRIRYLLCHSSRPHKKKAREPEVHGEDCYWC